MSQACFNDFKTIIPQKLDKSHQQILSQHDLSEIKDISEVKNHYTDLAQLFHQYKQANRNLIDEQMNLKKECIELIKEFQIEGFQEQLLIAGAGVDRNQITKIQKNERPILINFGSEILYPFMRQAVDQMRAQRTSTDEI